MGASVSISFQDDNNTVVASTTIEDEDGYNVKEEKVLAMLDTLLTKEPPRGDRFIIAATSGYRVSTTSSVIFNPKVLTKIMAFVKSRPYVYFDIHIDSDDGFVSFLRAIYSLMEGTRVNYGVFRNTKFVYEMDKSGLIKYSEDAREDFERYAHSKDTEKKSFRDMLLKLNQ